MKANQILGLAIMSSPVVVAVTAMVYRLGWKTSCFIVGNMLLGALFILMILVVVWVGIDIFLLK